MTTTRTGVALAILLSATTLAIPAIADDATRSFRSGTLQRVANILHRPPLIARLDRQRNLSQRLPLLLGVVNGLGE